MSVLKVDTITKADGTGSLSVPAESGTVVTTASPSLGRRNLVINGAMQVAQRGTSDTGKTAGAFNGACDRYRTYLLGGATYNRSQSTDAPDGFANSLKLEVGTADSSLGTSDQFRLQHRMEGQNLQMLKKGTASAETLTVSFWVKSSLTGQYTVNLRDADNNRNITKAFTVSTANTWENKTLSFAGDTTGALDNDNGNSLELNFWLAAGTNHNSGSSGDIPSGWVANDSNVASGNVNWLATSGNTFYLTGVQLEVGSVATPFEHRSYGEELALCQRYYWQGTVNGNGYGFVYGTTAQWPKGGSVSFPTTMRAYPTGTIVTSPSTTNCTVGVSNLSESPNGFFEHLIPTTNGMCRATNGEYAMDAEL